MKSEYENIFSYWKAHFGTYIYKIKIDNNITDEEILVQVEDAIKAYFIHQERYLKIFRSSPVREDQDPFFSSIKDLYNGKANTKI